MFWLPPLSIYTPEEIQKFTEFNEDETQCGAHEQNTHPVNQSSHLLSIRIRLECNVPVIVVRKLDANDLRTVVVLEQGLHFLIRIRAGANLGYKWSLFRVHEYSPHFHNINTSTGVVSGTSRRMMMQRLWFGRTFSPFSSTWTIGDAEQREHKQIREGHTARASNYWIL